MDIEGPDLCHTLAVRRSARGLSRLYDRHLDPSGLSISQFSILSLIRAHDSVRIADLARLLVMERTTLVRALKPLQTAGLVAGETLDRKGTLALHLTKTGIDKVAEAAPLWQAAQRDFEQRVGHDRAAEVRAALLEFGFHA